jgi:hypothetical protein
VRWPRFKIAFVMEFVVIAAIDFAWIRWVLDHYNYATELLISGALPMLNVLAISMLIARQRPSSRTFLVGFGSFGVWALVLYVVLAISFANEILLPYVSLFLEPLTNIVDARTQRARFALIAYPIAIVVFTVPQVMFAVLGGFVCRKRTTESHP